MEIISAGTKINFMKLRFVAMIISIALIGISLFEWFTSGDAKFGVDFLGGTEVVVKFEKETDIGSIRTVLTDGGISGAIVQAFEGGLNEYSIRLKSEPGLDMPKKIRTLLEGIEGSKFELLKEDFIGPTIGAEIRKDGLMAVVMALIGMLIYISFRFEFRFALGAIAALVHDVIITAGIFVLCGNELSTAVLAALLTIVGYSLNDTIIVFDRIRENIAKSLKSKKTGPELTDFPTIVNVSINQTLSRTILTSLTTLFVVSCLWLLGGGAVADLAFTLVIGVIVGTYSSMFVACPVVVALQKDEK